MGLFGKLKDAVGIGSLKADIKLSTPGISPGDTIGGSVVLSGAASDTKITSILLQLVNFGVDIETTEVVTDDYYYGTQWESYEKRFKHQTVLFETYLAQDFVVALGQNLELPIDIATPPEMLPTDKMNRYVLKAHVDIPGQIDARCVKPLRVLHGGGMAPMAEAPYEEEPAGDYPEPGERVLAYYEDAHYECTTLNIEATGIHVQWDDGTDSLVAFDAVLPSEAAIPGPQDLQMGQRVMARFEQGFYEATVGGVQPGQVSINWDDGTQSWVGMHDVRLL